MDTITTPTSPARPINRSNLEPLRSPHLETSFFVEALYPFNGESTSSLSFQKGDIIEVLTQLPSGWWDGVIWRQLERGWFPSNYVRRITDEEAHRTRAANEANQPPSDSSVLNIYPSELDSSHSPKLNHAATVWDSQDPLNPTTSTPTRPTFEPNTLPSKTLVSKQSPAFDPTMPHSAHNRFSNSSHLSQLVSSSSSTRNRVPSSSNSWAGWLPKVTDEGQIYYHNHLTGEISSEMPSANDEFDFELRPELQPRTHKSQLANQSQVSYEFQNEDPFKFLQNNGFSTETLRQHGLLSSPPPSPSLPSTIHHTTPKPPAHISSVLQHSKSDSSSAAVLTTDNSTHLRTLSSTHSDHHNPFPFHQTRDSSPRNSFDFKRRTGSSSDLTQAQTVHSNRQSFEQVSSKPHRRISKQIFQVSQHIKDNLKPIMDVPPTLKFVRMVAEIKDSISLLTHLTEPTVEDSSIGSSHSSDPHHLRDQLSQASMDLVDKIRYLLQASCQLDTAVLSMLNECSFAANFHSLAIGPARPFSHPISPYLSNRHSSSSSQSHTSSFSHMITNAHLHYPGLKHVSRKIASTLSKLTLSTRALWGLLFVRSTQTKQVDDNLSPTQSDTRKLNQHQQSQNRYLLEQKLRSECRMGVGDLSSSVDAFFNHFEGILVEQSVTGNIDSTASTIAHFPRHGIGHLVMPIESVFLPSGSQAANWRASGYDALLLVSSTPNDTVPPVDSLSPRSKRRFSTPSLKLDSDCLTQRLMPLIRQIRELAESLNSLLLVDPVKQAPTDELLITSEPPNLKCIERIGPQTADLVLTQVSTLIESTGNLLASAESFDIASSLEVDFDHFIWFDLIHDTHTKSLMGFSGGPDSISQVHMQLQTARRLVNNFQRAKQSVYDIAADLVHATQIMLTSGGTFCSTPVPSPAQPTSASPLFIIHQPWSLAPSPDRLFKTVHRLILHLESLSTSAHALIQEASEQINQEIKLGPINQVIKSGLFHFTPNPTSSQGSSMVTRRIRSSSSVATSHFRNHPPSPRPYHQSRGIEDEHAELERSTDGQPQDHTSEVKHPGNLNLHRREPSVLQDVDRFDSGSSKSPTRSKKVAKFFGEEAATQVMPPLKPVSNKPAFLLPDYGPDEISFNVDNQIRGGTIRGLVIKLTSHEGPDVPFLRVFLMTYRTFTTSHAFLDLLIERYHQKPPANLSAEELQLWTDQKHKVIKIRVINVIRSWIESHLSDEDAESIIQKVTEFSTRDLGDSNLARQVSLTCERRLSRGALHKMATPVNPPGNPPPTILPRNLRKIKFLDIDALELARQLTLVESKLFCQIQVNECLGKAWPKEFAKEGTPNIKAMIDMSNALTRWVAETILMQPEQKKRANTIKHFILVADRCRSLNNFSTLMQIIAGLNSTPIYRLRRTWETIPQKTLTLFAHLGSVMSPTKNYAAYRDAIRNMAPPCVPFVGVYLTDWTFIGDGNPDTLREKPHQINFNKRQKAAELIVQIQSYQSMPYQLTPLPVIVKFLEESLENPRDEKELYDLSLELEPRERDDEKIARLLAESGFL